MKTLTLFWLLGLVALTATGAETAPSPKTEPTPTEAEVAPLRKIAFEIAQRAARVYAPDGKAAALSWEQYAKKSPRFLNYEMMYDRKTITFLDPSLEVELDWPSGQFHGFFNGSLSDRSLVLYDAPPPVKWSEVEVVAIAERFATVLMGELPRNLKRLGPPLFKPQIDGLKFCPAEWYVTWRRTDKQGHVFARDHITVSLKDGFGPVGMGVYCWSICEDKEIKPIPREKAVTLADEGVKKFLAWKPAEDWLKGQKVTGQPTAELQIVNPNHVTEHKEFEALAAAMDIHARLAWVVTYETKPADEKVKEAGHKICIWIDAETGENLGGDFQ